MLFTLYCVTWATKIGPSHTDVTMATISCLHCHPCIWHACTVLYWRISCANHKLSLWNKIIMSNLEILFASLLCICLSVCAVDICVILALMSTCFVASSVYFMLSVSIGYLRIVYLGHFVRVIHWDWTVL